MVEIRDRDGRTLKLTRRDFPAGAAGTVECLRYKLACNADDAKHLRARLESNRRERARIERRLKEAEERLDPLYCDRLLLARYERGVERQRERIAAKRPLRAREAA
jgi:hypothetical protein